MAYDAEPGGDPRGANCPKCGQLILPHHTSTLMHFPAGPRGQPARAQQWHSECARPYWDKLTPLLNRLKSLGGA